jgi:serine/threonine-protein kinase
MEAWFARACAREPQERYASAQEFADGLRAAAGMPMQGRGPSLVDMSGSQGFGGGSATNQHAFASSGTSSGISRTGEAYVPNTGKRQLGIAVAIVSLLVGGAIVAAVVAFGRASTGAAHPAVSAAGGPTAQPPVAAATATATVDRLPSLEASANANAASTSTPSATAITQTHPEKPPVGPAQPQHGTPPSHPTGAATHANPSGGPAPAATVDLGY